MQLIIGCGGLIYTSDPGAPAASLLESTITFNSTILTPGAQFFCAHIKVFLITQWLFVHDKIQEHLNRLYHPVTGQRETYEKIKLQQPKRWITILSNELGRLASGVRDIVTSGTDTIFLFTRIKSQK